MRGHSQTLNLQVWYDVVVIYTLFIQMYYSVVDSAAVNMCIPLSCAGSVPLFLSYADYSVGSHVVTFSFETPAGSTKLETVFYNPG